MDSMGRLIEKSTSVLSRKYFEMAVTPSLC
jgi:hypothetical protein